MTEEDYMKFGETEDNTTDNLCGGYTIGDKLL
jgi:hypothetical protein